MVSSTFTTFLFGLILFISLNPCAYSHQDVEKQMVAAANALVLAGGSPLSLQKEIFDAVPTPPEARDEEIVRRKMIKMKLVLKKEMLKVNVETASLKVSSNHKGKTTSKHTSNRHHGPRHPHHHHHMKLRLGSFVALNADYHVPKSHPPKNN